MALDGGHLRLVSPVLRLLGNFGDQMSQFAQGIRDRLSGQPHTVFIWLYTIFDKCSDNIEKYFWLFVAVFQ